MRSAVLLLFVGVFYALGVSGSDILVECERLSTPGGWVVDAQFMDQMGSPYLLAHGLGAPVADAMGEFAAEVDGDYEVFARTKNWTGHWTKEAGGTFKLIVNGEVMPEALGTGSPEWHWQRAGRVMLKRGRNTVALHDLTGFDGRCDAIAFTTNLQANFDALRRGTATPASDLQTSTFDLVVCGGGVAGICTAITAARLGLKVALVEARPILGGANSSEVRVHLSGVQNLPPYEHLGDILSEFGPARGGNAAPADRYEDGRKAQVVAREKNITVFVHRRIVMAESVPFGLGGDRRIKSVTGVHAVTGDRLQFEAPLFVDCTGDGAVAFLAGADTRMGRESRIETGEEMAPLEADGMTMGASVLWYAEDKGSPCEFPVCPWMLMLDETNGSSGTRGDWNWETGMLRDQIREFERIRDYGMLVAYSNWAFAKNAGRDRMKLLSWNLGFVSYVAGKRESRRVMGDHILTQQDIFDSVAYSDGTCKTTWPVDLHYPAPEIDATTAIEQFRSTCTHNLHHAYPIPYRCFYSRNVRNLFVAGRNISVTHVALGSVRVQRTTGMMGEVVGRAASLCKRFGCLPRDIYVSHLEELKALMRKSLGTGKDVQSQTYNPSPMLKGDPPHTTPVEKAKPMKGENVKRICCIGDSITEGSPGSFFSYRWELDRLLKAKGLRFAFAGKTVDKYGLAHESKCGRTAWETFDRLYMGMGEANPDIIIMHCGHNADSADPRTIASLTRANRAIIAEARAVNPRVTVLLAQVIESGKLPKYAYIPELNRNLVALAKELNMPESPVVTVDLPSVFNWKTDTVADKVHPNEQGATKIAKAFAEALEPFIK